MKSRRVAFVVVATTLTLIANGKAEEDPIQLFEEGVTAVWDKNDSETAIRKFEEVAKVSHSVNLHANLAKLYSNKKQYGRAILHFKKGLLLDPNNLELQEGLAKVRELAGLKESEEKPFFSHHSLGTWSVITATLFWTGLILWLFPFRPTLSGYLKILILVIWAGMTVFSAYATWKSHHTLKLLKRQAIVVTSSEGNHPTILLHNKPISNSNDSYEMQAGEIVRVEENELSSLKRHQSPDGTIWFYAETLSGKKRGWIKQTGLEFLLP